MEGDLTWDLHAGQQSNPLFLQQQLQTQPRTSPDNVPHRPTDKVRLSPPPSCPFSKRQFPYLSRTSDE